MIEIWLSSGTDQLRLPILPAEVTVTHTGGAQRSTLQALGEVILSGKRKLQTLTLESYFPARCDGNCQYLAIPLPSVAAALLRAWINDGTQARLLITGGALDVNMPIIIEGGTFTMGKAAGDVAYSLTLTEYQPFSIRKV